MTDPEAITTLLRQHSLEGQVRATARHHEQAGKPYRPSTGTEGAWFDDQWCVHCTRDAAFRDDPDRADGCPIIAASLAFKIGDPNYPKEWVFDHDGRPSCTAFTQDPSCPVRCEKTIDMFNKEN